MRASTSGSRQVHPRLTYHLCCMSSLHFSRFVVFSIYLYKQVYNHLSFPTYLNRIHDCCWKSIIFSRLTNSLLVFRKKKLVYAVANISVNTQLDKIFFIVFFIVSCGLFCTKIMSYIFFSFLTIRFLIPRAQILRDHLQSIVYANS